MAAALLASGTIFIIVAAIKPSNAADDAALLVTNPVLIGTAEMGEYPQTYVGKELNEKLKTDGVRTDKIYTAMLDGKQTEFYEYRYADKSYIRVDNVIDIKNNAFADGTVMKIDETYFFAVTPILWDIFRQGEKMFAVAHNAIATVNFIDDAIGNQTMWNNSYLRSWLNNYFTNDAELGNLAATRKYYASSSSSDTDGDLLTDKMWTPSYLEIQQFYPLDADRIKPLNDFAFVGFYNNDNNNFYLLRTTNGQELIGKVRNLADRRAPAGSAYVQGGKSIPEACVPAFVLNATAVAEIYGIPTTLPDINYDGTDHTVRFDKPSNLAGEFSYQYTCDGVTVDNMTVVGNYTIKTFVDGHLVGTTAVSIKPVTIGAVTLSQDHYPYTGASILPTVIVAAGDKILTPDVDYVLTAINNVDRGTARYSVTGIGNYTGTLSGNFTIDPQVITRPAADATNYVYNGEAQTYQIVTHDAYAISANTTQTNAGRYSISVSLKDVNNYVWDNQTVDNLTYLFNIARQPVVIPAPKRVDLDANADLLIASRYQNELYTVQKIRNADGSDPRDYLNEPVKNGSYKVMLALNDRANYLWQDGTDTTVTVDFAINVTYEPNVLTGTVQIEGWTYGATANTPNGVDARYGTPTYYYTTDTGVASTVTTDDFNIGDWTPWFNDVPHSAGEYFVIAYVPATDTENVAVHSDATRVTIAQKTVTVGQVVMAVKTYDGTTAGAGQIVLDGVLPNDIVNVTGDIAWTDSAAGTKSFTVTNIAIDNVNYVLGNDTYQGTDATGILYRKVMRPTADTRAFTYNGREQRYDIVRNDYYTVDGATQTDAGDYTVTVALLDNNYQWDDETQGTLTFPFTIDKANLTVTVAMTDVRLDAEPIAPVITATLNGVAFNDLPFVVTYLAVDDAEAEPTDTLPNVVGNYRVTASLLDHQNFNDVTAVSYCQVYQLVTAEDGLGSLVIAADGSYGLTLTAGGVREKDGTTSVDYTLQISRDNAPVPTVGAIELQILIPPALQSLAKVDNVVAFDLLQKHLTITVNAGDATQKINQYTLVAKDGQVYAVFAYSGAGQADVMFAYSVPVPAPAGFNWGIFIGSALVVAAVVIFIVAVILVLRMKKPKISPVLLK